MPSAALVTCAVSRGLVCMYKAMRSVRSFETSSGNVLLLFPVTEFASPCVTLVTEGWLRLHLSPLFPPLSPPLFRFLSACMSVYLCLSRSVSHSHPLCMLCVLTGHIVVCPSGAIGGVRYDFPLLGALKPGHSAAPKLEQCSTTPPSCDAVDGAEYTVSVTNGGLNDVPAPTAIMACQRPNTACPSFTHYPRINANGTIYACRSVQVR